MSRPLRNPRHELIAQERATGKTPEEAARLAGYTGSSLKSNARRLCNRPDILARVQELQRAGGERTLIQLERVIIEQGRIAFFNLDDVLKRDERGRVKLVKGWPVIDFQRMTPAHWAAIAEVDNKNCKLKLHDKVPVLRDLLKYFAPDKEMTASEMAAAAAAGAAAGAVAAEEITDSELIRRLVHTLHKRAPGAIEGTPA